MTEKKCSKCGEIKDLDVFSTWSQSKDGKRPYCKPCQKIYRKYLRETYPATYRAKSNNRRARQKSANGRFTAKDWNSRLDYYGGSCIYCGSSEQIEVEHRIPLSRGGTNWPSNLAPACKSCNCKKGTKTEFEFKSQIAKEAK